MPIAAVVSTGYGVGYAPTSWTKSISAARILPSASKAIRTVPSTWRDCPADIRFSRRSSIHFSGAGTLRAASMMLMSSRIGTTFWPNPPPVSRTMTRTPWAGMPSSRAAKARSSCGVWVEPQMVSSEVPAVHSTTMPRVSIGTGTYICW